MNLRTLVCLSFVTFAAFCSRSSGLSITNGPATNITATAAVLRASLVETNGCASNPTVIVYYGDNNGGTNPASWDYALTNADTAIGVLSLAATNLVPATMYWHKARAAEAGGTNDWADTAAYFWTLSSTPTAALAAVTFHVAADSNGVVVSPTNFRAANQIASTGDTAAIRAQIGGLSNLVVIADTNLQAQVDGLTNAMITATQGVVFVGTRPTITNVPASEQFYLVDGAGRILLAICSADAGGLQMGRGASALYDGVCLGYGATGDIYAVALGPQTLASGQYSVALGLRAMASGERALQLGQGTNATAWSLQVFDYPLLDASGRIPAARIGGYTGVWTNYGSPGTTVVWYSSGVLTNKVQL